MKVISCEKTWYVEYASEHMSDGTLVDFGL